MKALDRMEDAREALEEGDAPAALARLPKAGALPGWLRPERDFLEAEAWRSMGFFRRAEALYEKVLARVRPAQDPPLWIQSSLGSAAGLRSLGAVAKARKRLAAAGAAARRYSMPAYREALTLESALIDRAAGFYGPSIAALSAILRTNLARKAWQEASFTLWAIGGAERFRGRLAESEKAFLRSLALAKRAGDPSGEGYACFGLGGVTRIRGRLADAAKWYARAERVFRGGPDLFARAYACCGLANALRQQGRLREAEKLYHKSHALYSRLEDAVDLAYVDWGLGQIRLRLGDPAGAVPRLKRALEAFREHDEHRGTCLSELSLAQAYHATGRTEEAERLFLGAYRLARKSGLHAHLELFT